MPFHDGPRPDDARPRRGRTRPARGERHRGTRLGQRLGHRVVLVLHVVQERRLDPFQGEHRPDVRVSFLVVPGRLPAEVDERAVELPGVGHVPVGKLSSAAERRSRSRRTAPWISRFIVKGSVILVTLRVESTAEGSS